MNKHILYWLVPLGLGLIGCAASLPHVSPMQAQWAAQRFPGMDVARFEQARATYADKCSTCHNAVVPAELSMEKWATMLNKMAPKAKLTPGERDVIWSYIATVHDAPADPK